jgi:4,5-dihydroxyphthalate decarboxylase
MHTIGIRRDLVAEHPRLPKALYEAFQQAKRIAMAELAVMNAPKVSLPWIAAELAATEATMGADFWPYGFAANRPVLEQIARYSHEDGLTPRPIPVDELFENTTHDL